MKLGCPDLARYNRCPAGFGEPAVTTQKVKKGEHTRRFPNMCYELQMKLVVFSS